MEIKNRLFPYPVLCGDTDDYLPTTEFSLEQDIKETTHEVIFIYEYALKCDSLETLIRKGEAEYVLHIECGTTAFRTALKSGVPHIEYRLPKSRVNGEVKLVAMIVAKVDINSYKSAELNEDYISEDISFRKGSILAYQNLPTVYVRKNIEELANNESFFKVIKQTGLDENEIRPLTFNLNSEKIQILVDKKTFEAFVRYKQSNSIAMAMLILPALTYMILEVSGAPDSYSTYTWFQQLDKYYKTQNMDFITDVINKDENPVNIAQEMLQNPIGKAYRELYALGG